MLGDTSSAAGNTVASSSCLCSCILNMLAFCCLCCCALLLQINPEMRHDNPGMFNLLFGAYGFPVGLSMCVINGASLFTSNIAYMMAAFIERKSTGLQALWVVWLSYFSNLVGGYQDIGELATAVMLVNPPPSLV